MKKIISLFVALLLALSLLSGCEMTKTETSGKHETEDTSFPTDDTAADTAEPDTTEADSSDSDPDDADPSCPLFWKVTDGEGHTLYLFGTIHVGDERNEDVFNSLKGTLAECDALAVEFDVVAYENDMAAMIRDIQTFLYTDGTRITDHCSAEMYEKMKQTLEDNGYYNSLYEMYDLALWSQLLDTAYVDNSSLSVDFGMDRLLIEEANRLGIQVLDVESSEFQTALSDSFSDELNILMIEELLDMTYEEYDEELEQMYEACLKGDADVILGDEEEDTEGLTEEEIAMVEDYNYKMVDERNVGMVEAAKEYLEGGQTVFFAVGCGHMVGEAGIVSLLEAEGYTVERVPLGK